MQIISGFLRGRRIKFPEHIRPTQNKVRKAVFDCLGDFALGASFLELFAGSGAVGIEALSCGAKEAVFVDSDMACLKAIESNLRYLSLSQFRICEMDSLSAIDFFAKEKSSFDIIFLDPPYAKGLELKKCLLKIAACGILTPLGIVISQHQRKVELPEEAGNGRGRSLLLFKQKKYGDTVLSFYRR